MNHRYKNYDLTQHNTFGITAFCNTFVEYESVEDLQHFLQDEPNFLQMPYLHIGGGSNLVFTSDFAGTILHSCIKGKEVIEHTDHVIVKTGSGENWDEFVAWCIENEYYGLENLSLIPGEVGASAVQNIGAYGSEVKDFITEVEAINLSTGERHLFSANECQYAYRHSIFKNELKGKFAITHVSFKLAKKFQANISYGALQASLNEKGITNPTAQDVRKTVIEVRNQKLPDPSILGNAGSFFMNPVINEEHFSKLKTCYPNIPNYPTNNGIKIPAGWLIEQCGWKGKRVGNAGVYEKQALVLVNHGGADGNEIKNLAQTIANDIEQKFGIRLCPEANFI